jgi:23S rRNA (cytidine2498-2'-O)-methyltransferase
MRPSDYFFVACQPGGEALLKAEVGRLMPRARLAFSRRGLVTFKVEEPIDPSFVLSAVFAREMGASYGQLPDADLAELARSFESEGRKVCLAVFAREPGQEDEARSVHERLSSRLAWSPWPPAIQDVVVDVAVAPGETPIVGAHVHGPEHSLAPGGWRVVHPPEASPSRAYAKIEEAILWSGAVLAKGDVALEIGSAPGGASFALLERGLVVHGVDPGAMSNTVLAFGPKRFIHHRMPVGALKKDALPRPVHWFAMDMNLAPRVALRYAERVVVPLRKSLLGAFFTLKMNSPEEASDIDGLLRRIQSFGFPWVRAKQLPSHRREIVAVAFTEHALANGRAGGLSQAPSLVEPQLLSPRAARP